ncbi:hypothetical protein OFC55_39835, partial [Escherichia coli]|nr:hypothetical protein [Escherichia coli]
MQTAPGLDDGADRAPRIHVEPRAEQREAVTQDAPEHHGGMDALGPDAPVSLLDLVALAGEGRVDDGVEGKGRHV